MPKITKFYRSITSPKLIIGIYEGQHGIVISSDRESNASYCVGYKSFSWNMRNFKAITINAEDDILLFKL